jgi:hypothetical protein
MSDDVTRMPMQECPHCGYKVNAHGPSGGTADGAEIPRPGPGDFTVCIACARVSKYSATMKMIATTLDDPDLHPDSREEIRNMIYGIEQLRRQHRDWPQKFRRRSRG